MILWTLSPSMTTIAPVESIARPLGRLSPSAIVTPAGGAVWGTSFSATSPPPSRPTTMITTPIQRAAAPPRRRAPRRRAGSATTAWSAFGAMTGTAAVASKVAAQAAIRARVENPSLLQIWATCPSAVR